MVRDAPPVAAAVNRRIVRGVLLRHRLKGRFLADRLQPVDVSLRNAEALRDPRDRRNRH
jgi:hypothetical protein